MQERAAVVVGLVPLAFKHITPQSDPSDRQDLRATTSD